MQFGALAVAFPGSRNGGMVFWSARPVCVHLSAEVCDATATGGRIDLRDYGYLTGVDRASHPERRRRAPASPVKARHEAKRPMRRGTARMPRSLRRGGQ